jgi:hypothetical protein
MSTESNEKNVTCMIQVNQHPFSGTRTLQERIGSEALFKDCGGSLFCNLNAAEFYRTVAERIAKRSRQYEITYKDTSQ